MSRPSWDEYFMEIARTVGARATCDRGKVGVVIVKDRHILATGYAGAPKGLPHCDDAGHLIRVTYDEKNNLIENCIRTTHAEINAIVQAALSGVSIKGGTIYCKMEPCLSCTKSLINAGIVRVVCEKKYHDAGLAREFLKQAGVELVTLSDEIEAYSKQNLNQNSDQDSKEHQQ